MSADKGAKRSTFTLRRLVAGLRRGLSLALRLPISGPMFRLYAPRRRWPVDKAAGLGSMSRPRVLVVNLMGSLGDTICYLALADVLAAARSDVEITWLADSSMAELLRLHRGISKVLTVTIRSSRLLKVPTVGTYYRLWRVARAMGALSLDRPFDCVLLPRGGVDPSFSAHAVWMLNVPRSFGYSYRVEPEEIDHNYGDCLLTDVLYEVTTRHEALRPLVLLEASGLVADACASWDLDRTIAGLQAVALQRSAYAACERLGIGSDTRFAVIAPGSGLLSRSWPAGKFREICRFLIEVAGIQVVLTGRSTEKDLCNAVMDGLDASAINAAGKLSILDVIALISKAVIFLGNDSGAGHISGALGRPTISLNGQAKTTHPSHIKSPEHYRPPGPKVLVVQPDAFLKPCEDRCIWPTAHCIDQILVHEVREAVASMLELEEGEAACEEPCTSSIQVSGLIC